MLKIHRVFDVATPTNLQLLGQVQAMLLHAPDLKFVYLDDIDAGRGGIGDAIYHGRKVDQGHPFATS
jgi:hypothetical protein